MLVVSVAGGIKVTSPDTQSAILHSDAKIICQATASFNLTFTWYKDKIWSRIKSGIVKDEGEGTSHP